MNSEQQRIASGCKCRECFGLAETMLLESGRDFGLERAPRPHDPETRLHVVTPGISIGRSFAGPLALEQPCTDEMTCDCKSCVRDRRNRTRGGRAEHQPWMPRPARQAA